MDERPHEREQPAGLAHVATVSFLASRAAPSAAFWLALAGGVALARAAACHGLRQGYGVSTAAMLQTVAIMGPARVGNPLTQAMSAPLLGRLEARGSGFVPQVLACGVIRLLHNAATTAFFIWVIVGGLDAYAGSYDSIFGRIPGVPEGSGPALILTGATLVGWTLFASPVQVLVYRRGLRRWDTGREAEPSVPLPPAPDDDRRRFDPRGVALAAVVAFCLLLAGTAWPLLAGVAIWLGAAWVVARPDRDALPVGLTLAALLGGGALLFSLVGGLGVDVALRRGSRAALLVLVATWLRGAAGPAGLREVFRRTLGRLRRIPSVPETVGVLDELGTGGRFAAAGRTLLDRLSDVRMRPLPVVDAVLGWVTSEARAFKRSRHEAPPRLALRGRDLALVALAAVPALALVGT